MSIEADQAVSLNYETGTITSGCGTNLGHGVLAAGYDNTAGYYLVKMLPSAHVVLMSPVLSSYPAVRRTAKRRSSRSMARQWRSTR